MSDHAPVLESQLDLELLHRGKVRDVYAVDDATLLMVASDRVSAFDVVLPQPIPGKGEVLTLVTAWWLEQLEDEVAHHLIAVDKSANRQKGAKDPAEWLPSENRCWYAKPGAIWASTPASTTAAACGKLRRTSV